MNILTFDLEDWFHILDHPETEMPEQWDHFESRLEKNVERVLQLLEVNHQKSTWFCLGWIVQKYPLVVKKIALNHELACHSDMHQLVYKQSQQEFKEDTRSVIKKLEDLVGKKITAYRASGFSITKNNSWAFEVLAECGIEIDCSIFPASRNHGGFPDFEAAVPCRVEVNGISLKEFPLNTYSFVGKKIIFSGGGYFRLLPYPVIRAMTKKSDYVMSYFHPRDFDPDQPMISSLPWKRKFMSYTGLKHNGGKFSRWIKDFSFVDLMTADKMVDWNATRLIRL